MDNWKLDQVGWRKSSRSNGNGGNNCVELAGCDCGVAVRDSKNPDDGVLVFGQSDWRSFAAQVRRGTYDLS